MDVLASLTEAISDLAVASMEAATAAEGAVLGLCLHLCRLQIKIWDCNLEIRIFMSGFLGMRRRRRCR